MTKKARARILIDVEREFEKYNVVDDITLAEELDMDLTNLGYKVYDMQIILNDKEFDEDEFSKEE